MAGWFAGIEVPAKVATDSFAKLATTLRYANVPAVVDGIEWTDPDGWHSTLEWFGSLAFGGSERSMAQTKERARVKRPFVLQMHTPYLFHDGHSATTYLCADLRGDLDQWYLHSVSTTPHVTLAKIDAKRYLTDGGYRHQVLAIVGALKTWKSEWWMVDRLSLFESAGGTYTVRDEYWLGV